MDNKKESSVYHKKNKRIPSNAISPEEWISRAKSVHPEYDYINTVYVGCHTSVMITCPKHGTFSVNPKEFIKPGYKCAKCKMEEEMARRFEIFKSLASKVHNGKYTYPEQVYRGTHSKIIVICPKHGVLHINAKNHLNGAGCALCFNERRTGPRKSFEEFVKLARETHGDKYEYIEHTYVGMKSPMTIICPEHGEFRQDPYAHIHGAGCAKCYGRYYNKQEAQERFINRCKEVHGDKYDYSKTVYTGHHNKVTITCHQLDEFGEEHGDFVQEAARHVNGAGCKKCAKQYMDRDLFVKKANLMHDGFYTYDNAEYKNSATNVTITCPEHGDFTQEAARHVNGFGCKKCSQTYMDRDLFIKRANVIHDNYYSYDKCEYVNNHTKTTITCPEHGDFMQIPNSHLNGMGCPLCKTSHLERDIDRELKKTGSLYIYQYRNKDIFKQQSLDFYFPALKLGIECQGEQHYIANFFKSKGIEYAEEHLRYIRSLDEKKRQVCEENGIELVYYMEKKFEPLETSGLKVFTDKKSLVEYVISKTGKMD